LLIYLLIVKPLGAKAKGKGKARARSTSPGA
jgi:hypothetical protein